MLTLQVSSKLPAGVKLSLLKKITSRATQLTGLNIAGVVNLRFVSVRASHQLNQRYSARDYATDVLSFSYEPVLAEVDRERPELGDIAICLPIVRRQARQYRVSLESEVGLVLAHGLLHILGFDHQTKVTRAGFSRLQNDIMYKVNLTSRNYLDGHD